MYVVVGAGAVGLTLGARLQRAGRPVRFATRRPEAARAIAECGVRVEDPGSATSFRVETLASAGLDAVGPDDVALVCTRLADGATVADALARAAPRVCVAVQNGVDGDAVLAERLPRVVGAVYRQTCTRSSDRSVRALGAGRIVVGAHPEGGGPDVDALAADLRGAGYEVGVSARIAEDRWLKLCVNLMSSVNALVRRDDHATAEFVETKARLLEEAARVLDAAGIRARSCDGRDRSLEAEIAWQRASLRRGSSARRLPVYNQVFSALRHGGPVEADGYHGRILGLARTHGVAAPVNAHVRAALLHAARAGLGPECMPARALLPEAGGGQRRA